MHVCVGGAWVCGVGVFECTLVCACMCVLVC